MTHICRYQNSFLEVQGFDQSISVAFGWFTCQISFKEVNFFQTMLKSHLGFFATDFKMFDHSQHQHT